MQLSSRLVGLSEAVLLVGLILSSSILRASTAVPVSSAPDFSSQAAQLADGPWFPPAPWENVTVADGPWFPPAPWENVTVADGPWFPPAPWENVTVADGPWFPPAPWENVRVA